MEITVASGKINIYPDTVATSAPTVINCDGASVRLEPINNVRFRVPTDAVVATSPYDAPNGYQKTDMYQVAIVQFDRTVEVLDMGAISNQPTWVNSLAGMQAAIADLSVAL